MKPEAGPEALAALHARSFTTPRPWNAREFASLLAMPGSFLKIRPQAFVLGRAIAGEAELLTLAVAPEARRHGTGRALVEDFTDEARDRGAETAFLEVAADNAPARALYAATGWEQTGARRGYYTTPEGTKIDALILRRPLK